MPIRIKNSKESVRPTSELPRRSYRREPIVLALVALTALVVVHATSSQDITEDEANSRSTARAKGHY